MHVMRCRLAYSVLVLVLAVAGCGVSAEDRPREIEPPRGPFPDMATAAPTAPEAGAAAEPLYFVRADRLVAVIRRLRTAPTVQEQVQHLIAGPTGPESAADLASALNGTIEPVTVTVDGNQATIEVGDDVDGSGRSAEVLAFGQIVCTLTARPDVAGVSFRRDGRPLGVPRDDGSLSTGPLTAADYAALTAPA
jgi:spore germination protein GerM